LTLRKINIKSFLINNSYEMNEDYFSKYFVY